MPIDAIFGRPSAPAPQIIQIPSPPTQADPAIEKRRLDTIAARARAQGRDSTIYTDINTEQRQAPILKPNLGSA